MHNELLIWMNGLRVGTWSRGRNGRDELRYVDEWSDSEAARALSLSLPLLPESEVHAGAVVRNFFENLLPDSPDILRRVQTRFGTDSIEAFDLLSAVGRDCVGAVQLLPPGKGPLGIETIDAEPLSERGVEQLIAASLSGGRSEATGDPDDFRISIAGAQEKTALLKQGRKWLRPRGTTPTTHILKLPLGLVGNLGVDMSESVENEWLCSRLLRAYGLSVANCDIARFGRFKVLAVERFDRAVQPDGWIARLPQEDMCQALGVPAAKKYESDGGPGMRDILRVLSGSSRPDEDRRTFVQAQILFWLLAATDGHAKNFSIFHQRGGGHHLTPLYDVLSAWPLIGKGSGKLQFQKMRLAMAVRSKNAHWQLAQIQRRHWDVVARQAGLSNANTIIDDIVARTPSVLEKVENDLPDDFPPELCESIFAGIKSSLRTLTS